jgi:hypothetical protein
MKELDTRVKFEIHAVNGPSFPDHHVLARSSPAARPLVPLFSPVRLYGLLQFLGNGSYDARENSESELGVAEARWFMRSPSRSLSDSGLSAHKHASRRDPAPCTRPSSWASVRGNMVNWLRPEPAPPAFGGHEIIPESSASFVAARLLL